MRTIGDKVELKRLMKYLAVNLLLFSLVGCIGLLDFGSGYDKRALTVETVSLFNQRQPSRLSKKSWIGDWILRRSRLELIDADLKNLKPDVLALQELVAKRGSTAESDQAILAAGSLSNYEWRLDPVEDYIDTLEQEYLGFALAFPQKMTQIDGDKRQSWNIGTGGYLSVATFQYEGQPVDIFNVRLPDKNEGYQIWYSFLEERIIERLRQFRHCPKRVIVAGLMPGSEENPRYRALLNGARLKDSAVGFCQIPSRCYTSTPTNDIYMATEGERSPVRTDKILVSESAYVYNSGRVFDDPDPSPRYGKDFGINQLWPTQRFGWMSQIRLARCSERELDEVVAH
jgi:hypothetical protein